MASATPDLLLPSQSQDVAAPRLEPNYTAWWQRHMYVDHLPKAQPGVNSRPVESQAHALTVTHTFTPWHFINAYLLT